MPERRIRSTVTNKQTRERMHTANRQGRYKAGTNGQGLFNRAKQRISGVNFIDTMEVIRDRVTSTCRSGESEMHKITSQLALLAQMVKERWDEQRDLPWRTVTAITVAVMYFVGPFDIISDSVPFIGFLDDAAVLAFCFRLIKHDLKQYALAEGIDLKGYSL